MVQRMRPSASIGSPTVSIVVPCYNYGHYLDQAVNSALSQDDVDVEVIVVDDCSTDGSRDVAQKLAEADSRVNLVLHERNRGHIQTYNDGLSRAGGDHVVLLSADDMLAPGALARASAIMEARPDVGLVYGYAEEFTCEPPKARMAPSSWTVWHGAEWINRICARGMNIIINPEAMLRRSLMNDLVGYDQRLPHAADMDLWMRAAARANVARVNGVDQAFYRIHATNMHTTEFAGLLTDMVERCRVFDQFFATHSNLPRSERSYALARRSMAAEAMRCACLAMDRGGTLGDAEAAEFAEFARSCSPSVERSFRWRAYESRRGQPANWLHCKVTEQTYSLRWKVRWRRWRRFGS